MFCFFNSKARKATQEAVNKIWGEKGAWEKDNEYDVLREYAKDQLKDGGCLRCRVHFDKVDSWEGYRLKFYQFEMWSDFPDALGKYHALQKELKAHIDSAHGGIGS